MYINGVVSSNISVNANCYIEKALFYDFTSHPLSSLSNNICIEVYDSTFIQCCEISHGGAIYIKGESMNIIIANTGASHCNVFAQTSNAISEGHFAYIYVPNDSSVCYDGVAVTLCSFNYAVSDCRGSLHSVSNIGSLKNSNTSNCFAEKHPGLYFVTKGSEHTASVQNSIFANHFGTDSIGVNLDIETLELTNVIVTEIKLTMSFRLSIKTVTCNHLLFYNNFDTISIPSIGSIEKATFKGCYIEGFPYYNTAKVNVSEMLSFNEPTQHLIYVIFRVPKELLKYCTQVKKKESLALIFLFLTISTAIR